MLQTRATILGSRVHHIGLRGVSMSKQMYDVRTAL